MIIEIGDKKYSVPRARAVTFRKALVLTQGRDISKLTVKELDGLVEFCCEVLENSITVDEFYNECYGNEIIQKIDEIISAIVRPVTDKMDELTKNV